MMQNLFDWEEDHQPAYYHDFDVVHQDHAAVKQEADSDPAPRRPRRAGPRSQGQPAPGQHKGHWSAQEKKSYHLFLEMHFNHFMEKKLRRIDKIFKQMAQFIETRSADQCRSHHQKMEKKYRSFPRILSSLRLQHFRTLDQALLRAAISEQVGGKSEHELLRQSELGDPRDLSSPVKEEESLAEGPLLLACSGR